MSAKQRRRHWRLRHARSFHADGRGHFSREETRLIGRVVIHETRGASGEELSRLEQREQAAVRSNTGYGKQLVARKFEEWQTTRPIEPANRDPQDRSTASNAAITPASSTREMFDALVSAAGHMDIEAMRRIGQSYLQSD